MMTQTSPTNDKSNMTDLSSPEAAALIAAQNDAFRKSIAQFATGPDVPKGKVVMTRGVAEQSADFQRELITKVIGFDAFDNDSDPYGWHEMGVIEIGDQTVWFKIDLLDVNYAYGAEDPTNPDQTRRVMTLLFPSKY